jgi:hypothetical protein
VRVTMSALPAMAQLQAAENPAPGARARECAVKAAARGSPAITGRTPDRPHWMVQRSLRGTRHCSGQPPGASRLPWAIIAMDARTDDGGCARQRHEAASPSLQRTAARSMPARSSGRTCQGWHSVNAVRFHKYLPPNPQTGSIAYREPTGGGRGMMRAVTFDAARGLPPDPRND